MDHNPFVDKDKTVDPDIETVRERLVKLGPAKTRKLAVDLGLSPETVSKFRRRHILEPGANIYAALRRALAKSGKAGA